MENNWEETNLAALSSDVSYGYTESATTEKVGPKFLRITDIQNGVVDWRSVPYCPIDKRKHEKYKLHQGDIVVARTGNSTGENYLFNSDADAVYASYLIRFQIDQSKANPLFVWYTMRSPDWWAYVRSSKTGSAQAGANAKVLGGFPINLPPLPEQKAIAHILGSLDDKIELNRRMNETLEAVAQALFKSWFVDFDPVIDNALAAGNEIPEELKERADIRDQFAGQRIGTHDQYARRGRAMNGEHQPRGDARKPLPEEIQNLFPAEFEHTEEMGWIPKGWGVQFLENAPLLILDGDRGKNYPKRTEFCQRGHCLFLNTGNVTKNGFNFTSPDFISEGRDKLLGKGKLQRGDIILTTRGTVGNFAYFDKSLLFDHIRINSGMVILRPSADAKYSFFLFPFLKSNSFQSQVKGLTTGSAQPQLPIRDIKKIMIPSPNNSEILSSYIKLIEGSFDQTGMRAEQSRILSKLRDTLLPQLLTGEMRIPEAKSWWRI